MKAGALRMKPGVLRMSSGALRMKHRALQMKPAALPNASPEHPAPLPPPVWGGRAGQVRGSQKTQLDGTLSIAPCFYLFNLKKEFQRYPESFADTNSEKQSDFGKVPLKKK